MLLAGCSRERDSRTKLEYWCYSGGGETKGTDQFWKSIAEELEGAVLGVDVRVVTDIPHAHYMSMLATRFIGGNPPDVFMLDRGELYSLAQEQLLLPLDDFIESDAEYCSTDYAPSMVHDSYVEGKRYSIPEWGMWVHLIYRSDLLAKAGVRPPETWQELISVCRTLQEKLGIEYPFAMDVLTAFFMLNWVYQNDAKILSPDHTRVVIDNPEFIEAVQFVHDLMYRYHVMNPALASGTKMNDLWSTGKTVIMMDGAWRIGRYDEVFPQWKGKWELAPLPAGKRRVSFYGGQHLAMSRTTRHADLAWRFMVLATNAENQMKLVDIRGVPPGNMKVLDMPEFRRKHPHIAGMRRAIEQGQSGPMAPFFERIWYDIFKNNVLDKVMNDADADIAAPFGTAAQQMQRAADDYWAMHPWLMNKAAEQ